MNARTARLQRQRVHQPAEHERRTDEAAEHHQTRAQLRPGFVAQEDREDERHEEREEHERQEVAGHLRPMPMSKASRITRKFSRPATMRKQLPYSYVGAVTVPAPA